MNIYYFTFQFFATCSLLMGLYVHIKRRDEIGKYFLAFSIFVAGWGYHTAELLADHSLPFIVLWTDRVGHFSSLFIPYTWLCFVHHVVGKPNDNLWIRRANLGLTAFLAAVCWTPFFISGVPAKVGYAYYPEPGPLYHIFPISFAIAVAYGFMLLFKAHAATTDPQQKKQLKLLIAGYLIAYISGTATFGPVYYIAVPRWVYLPAIIFPFLVGYAITNYGLLNAEEFIAATHRFKLMSLGMFSASINHEIKNPAYMIQGASEAFVENVRDGHYEGKSKDEIVKDALDLCRKNASQIRRVTDIIERFSAYVRPVDSTAPSSPKTASVYKTIDTVLGFTGYAHPRKKVRIKREVSPGLPELSVNERELEEILFNLIVNAYKAIETEGAIAIDASRVNGHINLRVSDTGCGISSDHLHRLFQPFYRPRASGDGTGLGLYITKHLVEKNKGTIRVESTPGIGTTFHLTFKAAK